MSFRLLALSLFTLLASLSIGSALADCASSPMKSGDGTYNGCEVVHGTEDEFRDAGSVPEAACLHICDSLNEIDVLAAESHKLDVEAGLGDLPEN